MAAERWVGLVNFYRTGQVNPDWPLWFRLKMRYKWILMQNFGHHNQSEDFPVSPEIEAQVQEDVAADTRALAASVNPSTGG